MVMKKKLIVMTLLLMGNAVCGMEHFGRMPAAAYAAPIGGAQRQEQRAQPRDQQPGAAQEVKVRHENAKECIVCLDNKPLVQLTCGHEYCSDCLGYIVDTAVREKQTVALRCPNNRCNKPLEQSDLEKITKDKNKVNAINTIKLQAWLTTQPNAKRCPKPNCSYAFVNDSTCPRTVACGQCKASYCSNCLLSHAQETSCQQAAQEQKSANEKASEDWKQNNTKPCPRCRTNIEKNDGCNHMTCQECKHEFCWICLGNWQGHGGGYYDCRRAQGAPQAQAQAAAAPVVQFVPGYDEAMRYLNNPMPFHPFQVEQWGDIMHAQDERARLDAPYRLAMQYFGLPVNEHATRADQFDMINRHRAERDRVERQREEQREAAELRAVLEESQRDYNQEIARRTAQQEAQRLAEQRLAAQRAAAEREAALQRERVIAEQAARAQAEQRVQEQRLAEQRAAAERQAAEQRQVAEQEQARLVQQANARLYMFVHAVEPANKEGERDRRAKYRYVIRFDGNVTQDVFNKYFVAITAREFRQNYLEMSRNLQAGGQIIIETLMNRQAFQAIVDRVNNNV